MFQRADTAFCAIVIQGVPTAVLRESLRCADTRRASAEHLLNRFILRDGDIVLLQRLRQGQTKHVFHIAVQQPGTIQFT